MAHEYDPTKNIANFGKHGITLADADRFQWDTAVIFEDTRKHYQERRFQATGLIDDRLYRLVFCFRDEGIRIISLRKANRRETKQYVENH